MHNLRFGFRILCFEFTVFGLGFGSSYRILMDMGSSLGRPWVAVKELKV